MTQKKCTHNVPLFSGVQCLHCDLLWHEMAAQQCEAGMKRHRAEADRLMGRIAARAPKPHQQSTSEEELVTALAWG